MRTVISSTVAGHDSDRRQALLDSLDGLRGCTRVREIQYRIERTESQIADLRVIDWPLRGRQHQGKTLYGDDISELERQIADLNAILDAAQARDERDRYIHLAGCLLEQALDELTLAVQAGSLTPGAALALAREAGQVGDPIAVAEQLLDAIDALDDAPPAA